MIVDERDSDSGLEVTILLNDLHQEYTSCWREPGLYTAGYHCTTKVVWSDYDLEDLVQTLRDGESSFPEAHAAQQVHKAKEAILGEAFLARITETWGLDQLCLWQLRGSLNGVGRAWSKLADALTTQVGGDDDAFDYWPNTMDMLFELAKDLDSLTGASYRKATLQVAEATLNFSSGPYVPWRQDVSRNEAEQLEQRVLLIREWGYPERWTEES